ncbi:MAG: VanZ family protein [Clostridiaceae bacterium]|nr:VanZ family protein [Clostridiaceae bacterium]
MHRLISWLAVVIWMAVIFNLSGQIAEQSNQLSTGVTEVVIKAVEQVAPKAEIDTRSLNHIIRKNAHFFSYLVLGLLAMNAFRRCGNTVKLSLVLSSFLCVIYAVSDEIHQSYVPGRSAQITDVLIDSFGAGIGLLVYWLVSSVYTRHRKRHGS